MSINDIISTTFSYLFAVKNIVVDFSLTGLNIRIIIIIIIDQNDFKVLSCVESRPGHDNDVMMAECLSWH